MLKLRKPFLERRPQTFLSPKFQDPRNWRKDKVDNFEKTQVSRFLFPFSLQLKIFEKVYCSRLNGIKNVGELSARVFVTL
jgi:hypothetical protein